MPKLGRVPEGLKRTAVKTPVVFLPGYLWYFKIPSLLQSADSWGQNCRGDPPGNTRAHLIAPVSLFQHIRRPKMRASGASHRPTPSLHYLTLQVLIPLCRDQLGKFRNLQMTNLLPELLLRRCVSLFPRVQFVKEIGLYL